MRFFMNRIRWILLGTVLVVSYFTYFRHYSDPPSIFWDENYHIASAQKYLNHVFFMEQHPPLGKLLVALGEKLWHANPADDQFINTDYGRILPPGFSFKGYRFFPALLGWLSAPLIFLIFLLICDHAFYAFLLSSLYVFDNAMIVHDRGAMIESPMIFFSLAMILGFLILLRWKDQKRPFLTGAALWGAVFGLVMTTKLLGLIMALLVPALLTQLYPDFKRIGRFCAAFLSGFVIIYVAVWQIHFSLGTRFMPPLENGGAYQASPEYRQAVLTGHTGSLLEFPVMLRDSIQFVSHYNRGVPRLNLCKPDENGSPFYYWPFGARAINYRWETLEGKYYRYLYLQCNPAGWLCGLLGVVSAFVFLAARLFFSVQEKSKNLFLIATFFSMYALYMVGIAQLDRVMYLYHYFTPLLFSFLLFGLVAMDLEKLGPFRITPRGRLVSLSVVAGLVFASYLYYSPLTYYRPISDAQFRRRVLLRIWDLHNIHDPESDPVAQPLPPQRIPIYMPSPQVNPYDFRRR